MEELNAHDDIVQDCDCHKCALAERDRLLELYKLSERVRNFVETDIRWLHGRKYQLEERVRELENQMQQLRDFRSA